MNLSSGIAPIRKYLDLDLKIGLGSDVAGGQSESIFRAITDSIQVSKMYWRHVNQTCKPIILDDSCLEHPTIIKCFATIRTSSLSFVRRSRNLCKICKRKSNFLRLRCNLCKNLFYVLQR